jgi:hypothetical protein
MKKVYGNYLTSVDVDNAVGELLGSGYTRDEIKVVSTEKYKEDKDLSENDKELLKKYRTNLEAGESVILVKRKTPDWDEREEEFYEDLDE